MAEIKILGDSQIVVPALANCYACNALLITYGYGYKEHYKIRSINWTRENGKLISGKYEFTCSRCGWPWQEDLYATERRYD